MSNYNKEEKHSVPGSFTTIEKCITRYLGVVILLAFLTYLLTKILPPVTDWARSRIYGYDYYDDASLAFAIVLLVLSLIPLYLIIRSVFVDIKGELKYDDTSLLYEGYSFDFFPHKTKVHLQFADIASAKIFTEKIGRSTREKMIIKKTNGTKLELNICPYDINRIINIMHSQLKSQYEANPIPSPQKYSISIYNYKAFLTGYLNLTVCINDNCTCKREAEINADVKTGDMLAIKHNSCIHILRLTDPSLTEYYIDDLGNDFNLIIKKTPTKDNSTK